jgi:predicted AlkP superfamily phosphohydrolase/phosphomutase
MRLKTLIIALDGAGWDLLEYVISSGLMPRLKALIKSGVKGELLSTVPPVTAPAWASFMTGKDPGKHGLYDFLKYDREKKQISLADSASLGGQTIWEAFSGAGVKMGLMHLPLTYPPFKVNGFMISGIPTPEAGRLYTYPAGLASELRASAGPYLTMVNPTAYALKREKGIIALNDKLRHTNRKICECAKYLLDKWELDFFMVHFQSFDVIQHALGYRLFSETENGGAWKNSLLALIQEYFSELDEIIDVLARLFGPSLRMVISDHGFGKVSGRININNYLERSGFLKTNSRAPLKDLIRRLPFSHALIRFARDLSPHFNIGRKLDFKKDTLLDGSIINWEKTRACVLHGGVWGLLYINAGGEQEKKRLREELKELLSLIRDEVGRPVIEKIYDAEDVYSGPWLASAPDLVLAPCKGFEIKSGMGGGRLLQKIKYASHLQSGVLMAAGENIKPDSRLNGARLIDLAPTLLSLYGLPVPQEMDGKILNEICRPAAPAPLGRGPSSLKAASINKKGVRPGRVYTQEQEKKIAKSLRGLGYL